MVSKEVLAVVEVIVDKVRVVMHNVDKVVVVHNVLLLLLRLHHSLQATTHAPNHQLRIKTLWGGFTGLAAAV